MRAPSTELPLCREMSRRLSEFLDGELDDAARHEVAVHLALCPECAELAADLAATVHALHALRPWRRAGADPFPS